MAKKTTVDEDRAGERPEALDADSAQDKGKNKGSGTVEEALGKEKVEKRQEPSPGFSNPLAELPKLRAYIQEVLAELKKVQWPTRKQVRAEVLTVISTVFLMTMFVYSMDYGFTVLSNMIFK